MSYTRKTWECGEVVTADALNNIEDGIEEALECCGGGGGGAVLIRATSIDEDGGDIVVTTDKTWQEISDAMALGAPCYVFFNTNADYCNSQLTPSDINGQSMMLVNFASASENPIDYRVFFYDGNARYLTSGASASAYLTYTCTCTSAV